ncbi:hypothetical protein SEVIR_7G026182v4 [Setaria viridis]
MFYSSHVILIHTTLFQRPSGPLIALPPPSSTASPSAPLTAPPPPASAASITFFPFSILRPRASTGMVGSRRRPFCTHGSWIQRVRRSTHRGAKLASSSSDGSPKRPVKVLVVDANAGSSADGSPVCIPVFGRGDEIPRSVVKIGEGDVPKMCDRIGEGGASFVPVPKMCDGIGDGGASSVPIPKMCDSGRRPKEPVKLGPVAVIGPRNASSTLAAVAFASITSTSCMSLTWKMKASAWRQGLYVPDSEEEDGHGHGFERPQLRRRAGLPGGDVGGCYNHGCAVVASTASKMAEKMTMVTNPVVQAALIQAVVDVLRRFHRRRRTTPRDGSTLEGIACQDGTPLPRDLCQHP